MHIEVIWRIQLEQSRSSSLEQSRSTSLEQSRSSSIEQSQSSSIDSSLGKAPPILHQTPRLKVFFICSRHCIQVYSMNSVITQMRLSSNYLYFQFIRPSILHYSVITLISHGPLPIYRVWCSSDLTPLSMNSQITSKGSSNTVFTTLDCGPWGPWFESRVGANILWGSFDCTGLTRAFIPFG